MTTITVRDLSDEIHRALKLRATQNARSIEAEIRAILDEATSPSDRLRIGSKLSEMSRTIGLTTADIELLERQLLACRKAPHRINLLGPETL
ncbi:FitA-like ribbon-helix-helix domain-containing protein [Bradyrhizobium sp. HKCCYLR20261]|uniref:FitA-like ribbon-helix-helix domain-containing protein n=1 Tax=unclassified Bradyrhizobium TaxID=2631580 RepID=UPI003EB6E897